MTKKRPFALFVRLSAIAARTVAATATGQQVVYVVDDVAGADGDDVVDGCVCA